MSPSDRKPISYSCVALGLAIVGIVALLATAAWTSQEFPNRVDRYVYEYCGEVLLHGGRPYADCWDNKPPGAFWLNALMLYLGGGSTYAVTIGTALLGLTAVVVTGWTVGRVAGRMTGAASALLFALVLSQRYFDALPNVTEFYAMVAEAVAAAALVRALGTAGWRGAAATMLAGAAFGAAGLMKQTAVAGPAAAAVVMLMLLIRGPGRGRLLAKLALLTLGGAAVVGAAAAILYGQSVLGEAYHAVITVNLQPHAARGLFSADLLTILAELRPIAGVVVLAVLGAVVTAVPAREGEDQTPRPGLPSVAVLAAVLWFVAAVFWIAVGTSRVQRYWHGAFVPLIYLAAQGLHFLMQACATGDRRVRATTSLLVAGAAAWFFAPLVQAVSADALRAYHYSVADSERQRLIEAGERIRALTADADRIFVWGFSPGVYRFGGRQSFCRFHSVDKVEYDGPTARWIASELERALHADPPRLIAVTQQRHEELLNDRIGVIPTPGLTEWFRQEYEQAEEVHGYRLYVRRSASEP